MGHCKVAIEHHKLLPFRLTSTNTCLRKRSWYHVCLNFDADDPLFAIDPNLVIVRAIGILKYATDVESWFPYYNMRDMKDNSPH